MARSLIVARALIGLALASSAAWSAQPAAAVAALAAAPLMAANTVSQPGGADYELGFRDALNRQAYRDASRRNVRYGEGFNGGTAKLKALVEAGADFDLGYRDAYNKVAYRDTTRNNVRYAEGFKAGETDHGAFAAAPLTPAMTAPIVAAPIVAAPAVVAAAAMGPDYELGYRDGLNKQAHRDASHKNVRYGEGYTAGQAKRESIAASGPDFELGYRDAFNKTAYRDTSRQNVRYADGYKAAQMERSAAAPVATSRPAVAPVATLVAPPVSAAELLGRNAAELEKNMKALGYTLRASFTSGPETFSTWQGKTKSQCMRSTVRDGKVQDMADIEDSNCL